MGAFVKYIDGISRPAGRPGPAAGITRAMYLLPHSMVLSSPMQQALEPKELVLASGRSPSGPTYTLCAKKVVASCFSPNQGLMTPWAVPTTSAARTLGSHTLRGKAHGPRCAQGVLCKGSREQVYRSGCGALGSSF